jgi:hypothetical protein
MKAITAMLFTLALLMLVVPAQACMVDPSQKDGMFHSSMDRFGKGNDLGEWRGGKKASHTPSWPSDDAGTFAEMGDGSRTRGGHWNGATFGEGNAGGENGRWNSPSSFFVLAFWQNGIADALNDFDWDCLENIDNVLIVVLGGYAPGNFDLNQLLAVFWQPTEPQNGSHVPVPGAVWLLASGLLGIAGLRKRRG